ncbi:MAG: enoyl-CoA hydratase/isomerase family protein, partial [Burkholderiaceae bacterium]|nr:enoyl-CoA hydratase/isomerase family protein [Burkholderiaceae bacterium]
MLAGLVAYARVEHRRDGAVRPRRGQIRVPAVPEDPLNAKAHAIAASSGDGFRVEPIEHGAIFRLARPDKLNALTRPMLDGLASCLGALEAGGARLVVIAAEGERAFCAGTDLAEMREMPEAARLDKSATARALFARISRSRVLSIAAINGLAFGGGLEIAMACTLRVAAAHASFSLPEIRLGLLPAYGGTQFLPALVGASRALDLMLTGRVLGAQDALGIGLVDRVVGRATGADSASGPGGDPTSSPNPDPNPDPTAAAL